MRVTQRGPCHDRRADQRSTSATHPNRCLLARRPALERVQSLRFNVTGLSGPVSDVKLRLWVTDASPNQQQVFAVSPDTWTESGAGAITYNTTPTIDTPASPLGGAAAPSAGAWVEIHLANSALSGNGLVSFALKSNGTNSAIFSSREGSNPPQLVITYGP
jgi:hypothetical protein